MKTIRPKLLFLIFFFSSILIFNSLSCNDDKIQTTIPPLEELPEEVLPEEELPEEVLPEEVITPETALSFYLNNGDSTKGWEISAGWKDNFNNGFSYNINAHIGDNKNKVLRYDGQTSVTAGTNEIIEGYPINTLWGYKADGLFQSGDQLDKTPIYNNKVGVGDIKYVDINGDGKISAGLY